VKLNIRATLISLIVLVAVGAAVNQFTGSALFSSQVSGGGQKSVTLVIDFGPDSGRQTVVKNIDLMPADTTGWGVFAKAGISIQGTNQYPTGFVCRIDGWPTVEMQNCESTPLSTQGHWAYFVTNTKLGQGWLMSGQGAAMHKPDCGSFEGWRWVAPADDSSSQPRVAPALVSCQ
jgi:hypothetical protein